MIISKKPRVFAIVCALILSTGGLGRSQDIRFARQQGPYYVGEPVVVQLIVRTQKAETEVACNLKGTLPDGLTVQGPQIDRSVRSFTQIINGRLSRRDSVDYRISFVATSDREGRFPIGPFEVTLDGVSQVVEGDVFSFQKMEDDSDMRLEMTLPLERIYVGQQVPVSIRWAFAGDIDAVRYAFANLQIRSPFFDQFQFDPQPVSSRTTLTIVTAKGAVEIDAKVTQEKIDGKEHVVVTGERTFMPREAGSYTSIPITCRTEKVVQWRRDLFGDLVPQRRKPAFTAGPPLNFVVKPIPLNGRPASFAGAVGRGFSIDVTTNRSVVRVGDPIALIFGVRGDGNLQSVSSPPLTASQGWSDELFQAPREQPAGTMDGNTKQFKLTVRVKDQAVRQIPAIAFSWFDPYQEQFQTTHSKPIALQVQENRVVSGADVIAGPNHSNPKSGNNTKPAPRNSDHTPSGPATLSFVGANLAIERDPARLIGHATTQISPATLAVLAYACGFALLVVGVVLRRHAQRDTEVIRKRKRLRAIRTDIVAAAKLPSRDGAEQVAQALRDLVAEFEPDDRSGADQVIARCETIVYCRGDSSDLNLADVIERAQLVVTEVAEK